MKCWICGDEATTREHMIKASDLRGCFRNLSQKKPIYVPLSNKKNIPVGSVKSPRFKSAAILCGTCNSQRTQPYDRAWEILSDYLTKNWLQIEQTGEFNLSEILDEKYKPLDVHLYFVKLFGCRIVEHGIPVDIISFSRALLERTHHNDVYLAFRPCPDKKNHKVSGLTQVDSTNLNGNTVFASWFYVVNQVAVNVMYSPIHTSRAIMGNIWHPSYSSSVVKLTRWN